DRPDGRRRVEFRAGVGRDPAQGQACGEVRRLRSPRGRGAFMFRISIRILALTAALACAAPALAAPPKLPAGVDPENTIVIDVASATNTHKGQIVIKLRTDLAPQHAERIKTLAREHFYDNVPFHRVIEGFMAQTGDGQNHNGTGGSKYPNLA